MTTDAWNAVRTRFVKLVTRSKRREAEERLETARERFHQAPDRQAEAIDGLVGEFLPLIDARHVTAAQLEAFIKSVGTLIETPRQSITASAAIIEIDQFNFSSSPSQPNDTYIPTSPLSEPAGPATSDYLAMLRQTTAALTETATALKESAAAQRMLTNKVVELSEVAAESQKEAHNARATVLSLLFIVGDLRHRVEEVTRERDELLDRLGVTTGQDTKIAELQRELATTQKQVRHWNGLYQRSQQELEFARERQHKAERVAEDALRRLARHRSTSGPPPRPHPDAADYEQALDNIAADREMRQERLSELENTLEQLSPPFTAAAEGTSAATSGKTVVLAPKAARTVRSEAAGILSSSVYQSSRRARGALQAMSATAILAVIGLLVSLCVFVTVRVFQDNQFNLADMHIVAGSTKPTVSTYAPTCYYTSCGSMTEDVSYMLRPSGSVWTTFQVSDKKKRYLNTVLSLQDIGRSCGSSPRVSYAILSGHKILNQGTLTRTSWNQISDLPIGDHAELVFQAALVSPPSGCALGLHLSNPTLDVLKGWSQAASAW